VYRCAGRPPPELVVQSRHGRPGRVVERQAEVGVAGLDRAERVAHEIVVADVEEPRRVVPGPLGAKPLEAAAPQLQFMLATATLDKNVFYFHKS
jgi:hypothetical protein